MGRGGYRQKNPIEAPIRYRKGSVKHALRHGQTPAITSHKAITPEDRSWGHHLKEIAVVVCPQDFLERSPGCDPEIDEGVFEKCLVVRDQDPITIAIPFLQVSHVLDPQGLLA